MAAIKALLVLMSAVLLANQVRAASIFFPVDETEPTTELPVVFKTQPKCAKNSAGLCSGTDILQYPKELIRQAFAAREEAVYLELTKGDDIIINKTGLGNRFGGSVHDDINLVEETAACAASESIIYPTMAKNTKNDWLYVANIEGVIVQGIRVEKCVDEGKPCKIGQTGTICRQKHIYRKLLAMDGNLKIEADNFRIPSACVCYIKNEFLLSTRFRNDGSHNSTKPSSNKRRRSRSRPSSRSRRQASESEMESAGEEARQASQSELESAGEEARQASQSELAFSGGEAQGLSGSPLDINLSGSAADQGTAQQSIETEETLNPSDTIGQHAVRFAGEIIVESNPIVLQKKTPKSSRRPN